MKSGDAQRNVQKNTTDNLNWRDQNPNIYNIYSKKTQQKYKKYIKGSIKNILKKITEHVCMP